jgi:hypothetical protein
MLAAAHMHRKVTLLIILIEFKYPIARYEHGCGQAGQQRQLHLLSHVLIP